MQTTKPNEHKRNSKKATSLLSLQTPHSRNKSNPKKRSVSYMLQKRRRLSLKLTASVISARTTSAI